LNIASVGAAGITFVITLLLARHWGVTSFGQYTFVLSLAGLAAYIVDFGMELNVTRAVARDPASSKNLVLNGLLLKVLLGSLALGTLACVIPLSRSLSALTAPLLFATCYVILRTILAFLGAVFRGFERMDYAALVILTSKGALLGCTLLVLAQQQSLKELFTGYAIVLGCMTCIAMCMIRRLWHAHQYHVQLRAAWPLLAGSAPFAVSIICSAFIGHIDVLTIRHFFGDTITGYYGASTAVIAGLAFLPANAAQALYPRFSQLATKNILTLMQHVQTASTITVGAGLVIMLSAALCAEPVVVWCFGEAYRPTIPILRLLLCAFAIDCMVSVLQSLLFVTNQERTMAKAYTALAVVYVMGIIICVPKFGMGGAAGMRVLLSVLFGATWIYLVWQRFPKMQLLGKPSKRALRSLIQSRRM
jgi:O-antigen/teichoic acid export membrane protein